MNTLVTEELVSKAIIDAFEGRRPAVIPQVEGYSSTKVRRLLNNLCSLPEVTYLEIGVHLGSTFIPALYGNDARATCIDNWSLVGNVRPQFEENILFHLGARPVNILEGDFKTIDPASILQPVNVYFFDGPHDLPSQYQAFVHLNNVFDQQFVAVIDDTNWSEPRDGSHNAWRDLRYQVVREWALPGDYNGSERLWWNGLIVAILRKTR